MSLHVTTTKAHNPTRSDALPVWITLSIEALLEIKQLKREGWRIDAVRWFGERGSWIEPLPQPGAATGGDG